MLHSSLPKPRPPAACTNKSEFSVRKVGTWQLEGSLLYLHKLPMQAGCQPCCLVSRVDPNLLCNACETGRLMETDL